MPDSLLKCARQAASRLQAWLRLRPAFVLFAASTLFLLFFLEAGLAPISLFLLPFLAVSHPRPAVLALALSGLFLLALPLGVPDLPAAAMKSSSLPWQGLVVEGASPLLEDGEAASGLLRLHDGRRIAVYGKAGLLQAGQLLSGRVAFRLPQTASNPGGFDEARWLRQKGVQLVVDLHRETVDSRPGTGPVARFLSLWARLRRGLFRELRRLLSPFLAQHLLALGGAGAGALPRKWRTIYGLSGLSHLTAVSGTHLGFALLPVTKTRRRLPARVATGLETLILVFLFLAAGGSSGVGRAVFMRLVARQANRHGLSSGRADPVFLAALSLLFLSPYQVLQAGYWMSVLTALTIRLLPRRKEAGKIKVTVGGRLREALRVSLAAWLVVLPFQFALNSQASLLAPLINVPALPLAGMLTLSSLCLLVLLPLARRLGVASSLVQGITPPLTLAARGLDRLAFWGAFSLSPLTVSVVGFFFWLTVLLALLILLFARGWSGRQRAGLSLFLALNLLLTLLQPVWQRGNRAQLEVWFFDVGQGDAALIRFCDGPSILVDGGNPGQGYDVLLPALAELGVRAVDVAFASHGHADHVGGLLDLCEAGRLRALVLPATDQLDDRRNDEEEADLLDKLESLATEQGLPLVRFRGGESLRFGGLEVTCLTAPQGPGPNDSSLQLLVSCEGLRILFTGDATAAVERAVVALAPGPVSLLKVAHHGARQTTNTSFLEAVKAKYAVISVGYNHYGHPAPEVLSRLDRFGVQSLRTDRHGAVRLSLKDGKVRIDTWRKPQP